MSSRALSASPGAPGEQSRSLLLYYLGTPAFALADLFFHVPVRVALPDGTARAAYYVVAFGLGLVCLRLPAAAPWVGMGESSVNLLILMLAVLLPIWAGPDALLAGGEVADGEVLMGRVANLALGGTVMVVGFHRARMALS